MTFDVEESLCFFLFEPAEREQRRAPMGKCGPLAGQGRSAKNSGRDVAAKAGSEAAVSRAPRRISGSSGEGEKRALETPLLQFPHTPILPPNLPNIS